MTAVAALGCAPPEPELRSVQVSQPIAGGYDEPDDTSVMGILLPASGALCSASLIAPNVLLTAGHCVAPTIDGDTGIMCGTTTLGDSLAPPAFFVTTAPEVTLANAGEFKV